MDELTAEKISGTGNEKNAMRTAVQWQGKIYSFLHIRDHLAQDPAQTYAKLKQLLSKDASFTQQNFISWRNHVQKQALQFFELSHEDKEAEVWEEWLHKQSLDKTDLYLLERLSYYAKHHHYKKGDKKSSVLLILSWKQRKHRQSRVCVKQFWRNRRHISRKKRDASAA